jgi:O-antigen ligase
MMLSGGLFRSVQLWTTLFVLVFSPLFFGSVDLFWISVWTILLSIAALCGAGVQTNKSHNRILLGFAATSAFYAMVALVQITPHLVDRFNDPIWEQVNKSLDLATSPRISSRAEIPLRSVGHFLLFTTSFFNGFLVGTSRSASEKLIRFAQYSILMYAIYGIAALILTPDMLLWARKVAYRGYLTATFVNHNTAATFLGAGMILWSCLAFSSAQLIKISAIRILMLSRSNEEIALKFVLRSAAATICLLALLLTGSRGGLVCSVSGLLVALLLMVRGKWRPSTPQLFFFALIALAVAAALIGGSERIASQGLADDNRLSVYSMSFEAIRQRPLLGTGLGTFGDMFPSFRTGAIWSWGVWDYAHSTLLEIAFEMGIPVAAATVVSALAAAAILVRAAVRTPERVSRRMLAGIAGVVTLVYLHSMFDFSVQIPGFLIVFGILLGCGLARAVAPRGTAQNAASDRDRLGIAITSQQVGVNDRSP